MVSSASIGQCGRSSVGCDLILAELGWRDPAKLIEYAVELGEAVESALPGDLGNLQAGVNQQLLGITDPGHLNIFCQRGAVINLNWCDK